MRAWSRNLPEQHARLPGHYRSQAPYALMNAVSELIEADFTTARLAQLIKYLEEPVQTHTRCPQHVSADSAIAFSVAPFV